MDNILYNRRYFKDSKDFQLKPERVEIFIKKIREYNPKSVLDVGCGLGALVNKLNEIGIPAIGTDFATDLKEHYWGKANHFKIADATNLPFEDQSFDLVFSSDFFEHIDEDNIDKVANEMKRVGRRVVAYVADDCGKKLNQHQRMYHLTHKDLDWWKEKLQGIEVYSSQPWKM